MKTKDAVVVITGASSGIGRATALELARQGASVVLVARREDALYALEAECEREGGRAFAVPTDVSIEDHVYGVAERAINHFGRIDVWINNAAVTAAGSFEQIPMPDFRRVLEVNLFGYIYGARAAVTYFKRQGSGILINVASMVAVTGEPYFTPYVISKFAIRGMSTSLRQELANENIEVCTVLPAVVDTPLYNQSANYMGKAIKAPGIPMPAEEVADAICGLIEDPESEIFVGAKARIAAALKFLAPGKFDKLSQETILEDHFEQEIEVDNFRGNLYQPMREYASVSGGWLQEGEEQKKPIEKYALPASLITGAAIGLAYFFRNKIANVNK
jgi:NAD(P)-dependent dehydrogenase (short-subunit alcohol dehydrogenase family)